MGQAQSADQADAPRVDDQDGSHAGVQPPPVTTPAKAPPAVARTIPATSTTPQDATTSYLARVIAEAEEKGAASRHDPALLRFQLDTVRQDAARRKEEHLARIQRELEEERREHSALPAIVLVDGRPASPAPRSKKPKPQPQQQAPLVAKPLLQSSGEHEITSLGRQQAQIHAANMEIIAQLRRQLHPESEPPQLAASPPPPAASPEWPMDTATDNFFFTSTLSYQQYTELDAEPVPWTPFMSSYDDTLAEDFPPSNQPAEDLSTAPSGQSSVAETDSPTTTTSSDTEAATTILSSEPHDIRSPDQQPLIPCTKPPGFEVPAPEVRSRICMENILQSDWLETLERQYHAGQFSDTGVRQILMIMAAQLEPPEQDELLAQFSKLSLKGVERVLNDLPQISADVMPISSLGCAPPRADTCKRPVEHEARRMAIRAGAIPIFLGVLTPQTPSLIRNLSTIYAHDVSPAEAAPDDPDGVARMRFNLIFTSPSTSSPANHSHKRKKSAESDDAPAASSESVSSAHIATSSSPPEQPLPLLRVHRSAQVNKAFEALTGVTQATLHAGTAMGGRKPGGIFEGLRSDHHKANHIIHNKWRLLNITEGHIYQVRLRLDGTLLYCLLHIKLHVDRGVLLSAEHAIIPLPVDDEHPLPPFVEGVDLDVDTLLYGYKPPKSTTQATVEVCQE